MTENGDCTPTETVVTNGDEPSKLGDAVAGSSACVPSGETDAATPNAGLGATSSTSTTAMAMPEVAVVADVTPNSSPDEAVETEHCHKADVPPPTEEQQAAEKAGALGTAEAVANQPKLADGEKGKVEEKAKAAAAQHPGHHHGHGHGHKDSHSKPAATNKATDTTAENKQEGNEETTSKSATGEPATQNTDRRSNGKTKGTAGAKSNASTSTTAVVPHKAAATDLTRLKELVEEISKEIEIKDRSCDTDKLKTLSAEATTLINGLVEDSATRQEDKKKFERSQKKQKRAAAREAVATSAAAVAKPLTTQQENHASGNTKPAQKTATQKTSRRSNRAGGWAAAHQHQQQQAGFMASGYMSPSLDYGHPATNFLFAPTHPAANSPGAGAKAPFYLSPGIPRSQRHALQKEETQAAVRKALREATTAGQLEQARDLAKRFHMDYEVSIATARLERFKKQAETAPTNVESTTKVAADDQ